LEVPFTDGNLTRAYLGSNTVAISDQLIGTALLIRETSGERVSVTDSAYYINKGILFCRNNDDYHISKDVLNSLAKN
jgi:hypothetical protein